MASVKLALSPFCLSMLNVSRPTLNRSVEPARNGVLVAEKDSLLIVRRRVQDVLAYDRAEQAIQVVIGPGREVRLGSLTEGRSQFIDVHVEHSLRIA